MNNNEEINVYGLIETVENTQNTLIEIKKIIEQISNINKKLLMLFEENGEKIESWQMGDIAKKLARNHNELLYTFNKLLRDFNGEHYFKSFLKDESAEKVYREEIGRQAFMADSFIFQSSVFTRTALLPLRHIRNFSRFKNFKLTNFSAAVDVELRRVARENPEFFVNYGKKTIHFLYVYGTEINDSFIPDSDNHDTGSLQNTIASFFPEGDIYSQTNIFFQTVKSDDVSEGTYITVTKGDYPIYKSQEIIDIWAQKTG